MHPLRLLATSGRGRRRPLSRCECCFIFEAHVSLSFIFRRLRTETAWSAAAQKAGAAGITFVNEIEGDLEAVPPTLQGNGREFQYLEDQYTLSDTLGIAVDPKSPTPLTDGRFFSFCDHKDCKLELCQCQDPETVSYAYTDGLFNFTYGLDQVVVECNPYCDCEMEDCPNRVAQRPRQIHIEVFKTRRCGWGVRTTVDVEKGQVLGVYTGKLIRRAEAEQLTGLAKEYCFDLDYNEGGASIESLYSVDALKCGNWTRFINHSCAPNVRVQPVVYDTMPAQKIAFLAFIATQFIPARTEFTFDYDPEAQRAFETARSASDGKRRSSSKSQPPRPSEATDCVCGAELCRGWVRTT
ncbi:SET domain-containing protein [Mycena galericulata]|nr:SET domain-containing protein [Mycena galericulata]